MSAHRTLYPRHLPMEKGANTPCLERLPVSEESNEVHLRGVGRTALNQALRGLLRRT
jgi:hypothetical protein